MDTVRHCWDRKVLGNPIWLFHQKFKKLSSTLSNQSKIHLSDIFAKVKEYEEKIILAEKGQINYNTDDKKSSFHQFNLEYIKFLKLKESILKQKSQLHWFKKGDANTKSFHALIRGRKRMLFIHMIQDEDAEKIQGDEGMTEVAYTHFENIFIGEDKYINEKVLNFIRTIVT